MDDLSATALKARRRLVNFRVTEEEYAEMAAGSEQRGARNLSEFARDAIFRLCHSGNENEQAIAWRLTDLEGRVLQLEAQIARLGNAMRQPEPAKGVAG